MDVEEASTGTIVIDDVDAAWIRSRTEMGRSKRHVVVTTGIGIAVTTAVPELDRLDCAM
jgi:hypothetical protein